VDRITDTREDAAPSSGEDPAESRRRRREKPHPPRVTTNLGWRVVRIVVPQAIGAFVFLLLTLYLSLRHEGRSSKRG
jgi:hypothetical protein